jgi:hypothetical protein
MIINIWKDEQNVREGKKRRGRQEDKIVIGLQNCMKNLELYELKLRSNSYCYSATPPTPVNPAFPFLYWN